MTEMSAAEAATVARFEAAQPAPESWRTDPSGLRVAVACYWHGAHYAGEVCGGRETATDFRTWSR